MSAAVAEIRTSAAMSAAAAVTSAAVAQAPAHRIAAAVATMVAAVAALAQAARRLAVAPVRVHAAAAAVARPAWRVRAGAAAERVLAVGAVVEAGDDRLLNHALIATNRKAGDDQPRPLSIQTCMSLDAAFVLCTLGIATRSPRPPHSALLPPPKKPPLHWCRRSRKATVQEFSRCLAKTRRARSHPEMPSMTV